MFNRFLRDFGRDFSSFGSDWSRPATSMFPSLMPPITQDLALMGRFPTVQRQRVWDEPLFLEEQEGKVIESKQVKTTTQIKDNEKQVWTETTTIDRDGRKVTDSKHEKFDLSQQPAIQDDKKRELKTKKKQK